MTQVLTMMVQSGEELDLKIRLKIRGDFQISSANLLGLGNIDKIFNRFQSIFS